MPSGISASLLPSGRSRAATQPLTHLSPFQPRLDDWALVRLEQLDGLRWGRERRSGPEEQHRKVSSAAQSARVLEAIRGWMREGGADAELAPIVLRGLASGYGTTDMDGRETRLHLHLLAPIRRRYAAARQWALEQLTEHRSASVGLGGDRDRLDILCERIARCWAIYRTWLWLRDMGAAWSGTVAEQSFQGKACTGKKVHRDKAFLWYELADVVLLGVSQGQGRWTLDHVARGLRSQDWLGWCESYALAAAFGEGRSFRRLVDLADSLLEPEAAERLRSMGQAFWGCLESGFRRAGEPGLAPLASMMRLWDGMLAAPSVRADLLAVPLPWRLRAQAEQALARAEQHLESVISQRTLWKAVAATGQGWKNLRAAMIDLVDTVEARSPTWAQLSLLLGRLRQGIEEAMADAREAPEYPWWPGDGEEYRVKRQRSAAEADRLLHLIGMAERLALAVRLLEEDPSRGERPSATRFRRIVEDHEACLFIEGWVSRFGPRLEVIYGGRPWRADLHCNRQLLEVDLTVREMVLRARRLAPDARQRWGWLFCGVTQRLRELVRRWGPEAPFVEDVELLLDGGQEFEALERIRGQAPVGAADGDRDVRVSVGIHIYNADPHIVRENMLHNRHLDWEAERLWLVLGSSSGDASIVEAERDMCLETGTVHWFLSARRHKKAGNQNRVIPNVPADQDGRAYYLTLDDDYQAGSQVLQRLVPLAQRHPETSFVQLPMYLYTNELLGISRGKYADAAGMSVWGSITSPGMRDLRIGGGDFSSRRALALPFGTCTLLRVSPHTGSFADTDGFHIDSVTEDFAQGLLAYGMKHFHYPRRPSGHWEDGILLDEIWIAGDGVELSGRIPQQTRWCEGSIRNAITIWTPAVLHHVKQWFGLAPPTEKPTGGGFLQLLGTTILGYGYVLEFLSMILFLVGFPLTVFQAVPAGDITHSLLFWGGLWCLHMAFHSWLGLYCGMSVRTYLDQHFIRFASLGGIAEGLYRAIGDPSSVWSANKDPRARLPLRTHLLFGSIAVLNLVAAAVGWLRDMDVYLLCLVGTVTALWQYEFLDAVPVEVIHRTRALPQKNPASPLASWLLYREGRTRHAADEAAQAIPYALPMLGVMALITVGSLSFRYGLLAEHFTGLVHRQPLFLTWLILSDFCQVLSLGWLWYFAAAGLTNRSTFRFNALIRAGDGAGVGTPEERWLEPGSGVLRWIGRIGAWLLGRRPLYEPAGILGISGLGIAVFLYALGLRLPHLSNNGAFMDEGFYLITGQRFHDLGVEMRLASVMFGSYLYPLMTDFFAGFGELMGTRVFSTVMGAVTAVSVAQVADRLYGHYAGLIAGLLSAILMQLVFISCLATYDVPSVAFTALGFALVCTALKGRGVEQLGPRAQVGLLAAAAVCGFVGTMVKYVGVVMLPAMALGVLVWSPPERRIRHLMAFCGPVAVALLAYGIAFFDVIAEWWRFSRSYSTLTQASFDELLDIYLKRGVDIWALCALALGGLGWLQRHQKEGRKDALVLIAGVGLFFAFHFGTRAHVNFNKHINYALPWLVPLSSIGVMALVGLVQQRLRMSGMLEKVSWRTARGGVAILLVLAGLYQFDRASGSLSWWPDMRPAERFLGRTLPAGARVLTDDTGLEWYLLRRGMQVDTPFVLMRGPFQGPAAGAASIYAREYDAVVLTGGLTSEGRALSRTVRPVLERAQYMPYEGHVEEGERAVEIWISPAVIAR